MVPMRHGLRGNAQCSCGALTSMMRALIGYLRKLTTSVPGLLIRMNYSTSATRSASHKGNSLRQVCHTWPQPYYFLRCQGNVVGQHDQGKTKTTACLWYKC